MPGATVTLTGTATGLSASKTTNAEGDYEFFTVKTGTYIVTAEKAGFSVALVDNVQVEVGARLRVNLQMAIGQLSEKVEVIASSPLLETDSSQRGQVITGEQTAALPLNGREYSALALLTTGVRLSALNRGSGTLREGSFNVNKVVTNNESAEYGRAAGATVNVAYKSGTNALHGDVWEFFRNTSLNATGFFLPPSGQKPPLDRNQFGGVLGGPIVKNRAFFFFDYEGFRQTRKQVTPTTIPTPLQRQGILPVAIRDPRNGVIYAAGQQIPLTPFASQVLSALPDPNVAGAANNHVILQRFTNDTDKAGGKIDMQVSPTLSIFGRYGWRDLGTDDQPPIPLPVRRKRQRPHLREEQAAGPRHDLHSRGFIAARGSLRLVEHAGRQEPARARIGERFLSVRSPGTAERPAHQRRPSDRADHRLLRPRSTGHQSAVAVSDRVESEGQLHVVCGPPLPEDGVRISAHRHRGDGRQSSVWSRCVQRPVHAARRRDDEQPLQSCRLHARSQIAVRTEQCPHRPAASEHALRVHPGRLPHDQPPHAQSWAAVRVRDADVGSEWPVFCSACRHRGHARWGRARSKVGSRPILCTSRMMFDSAVP